MKTNTKKSPHWHEKSRENEWGRTQKGIAICKLCSNYFSDKHWHHPDAKFVDARRKAGEATRTVECPACKMKLEGLCEGVVEVRGILPEHRTEIENLVNSFSKHAEESDCQHRLIKVSETKSGLRATFTENQLAQKLGKKIGDAFKKARVSITRASDPYQITRVTVTFSQGDAD